MATEEEETEAPAAAEKAPIEQKEAESPKGRFERALEWTLPYAPVFVAVLWLARITTRTILARADGPGVALDDTYIHFQYARRLAHGHFFSFVDGEGYTSGATSMLWPAMLAPFYWFGADGTGIIWVAWGFGWLFLALLAIETKRLAEKLVGAQTAIAASAAVLAFGGHTWFAASGMEVTPLAYLLCLSARLCADWAESEQARTITARRVLIAVSIAGPLLRPEGTIASALILMTLALFTREKAAKERLWALAAIVGPIIPPLVNKVLTGHFATSTTLVKWLPPNPYYGGANLWPTVRSNIDLFEKTILDGKEWSAIFLPPGSQLVALSALAAIPFAGWRSNKTYRAGLVLILAVSMLVPTTYLSFLWNRLRYLWPFTFAWCIGLACFARAIGEAAGLIRPRFSRAAPIVGGVFAGLLAHHLSWTMDDVATSAYAINNQQVKLGLWAKDNLPANARIGLNDTGAIAYFSERKTFDVCGLTSPREAKYWVAGPGSRFEHYERLQTENAASLPTHFIVYPQWMACEAVLGRELERATVTDQSILGGTTMIAYEARWDLLHSGDKPTSSVAGKLVDELDVSDLESEDAHHYDVLASSNTEQDNQVTIALPNGLEIADAGRGRRTHEVFTMTLPTTPSTLVARFGARSGTTLAIKVEGRVVDRVELPASGMTEERVELPSGTGAPTRIEIDAVGGLPFSSMHYWVYAL